MGKILSGSWRKKWGWIGEWRKLGGKNGRGGRGGALETEKRRKFKKKGLRFKESRLKLKRWLGENWFLLSSTPDWRNRQTRWIQNPLPARASRFDSGIRYLAPTRLLGFVGVFLFLRWGWERAIGVGERRTGATLNGGESGGF